MRTVHQSINGPWVLAGDFNIYRYTHEKNNSNISWAEMEAFNDWINELEQMDIEICNSRYTWTNKRREPTLVKLDRVLVNMHWGLEFYNSECKTLSRPTSDHKPLLLDNNTSLPKSNIFRYDDHWLGCNDLIQIIKNILTTGTRNMAPVSKLNHRLRSVRAATRAWQKRRKSFKTIIHNINHAVSFLDTIEEWRRLSNLEFVIRSLCQSKGKTMSTAEAQHWKRRAKVKWCQLGDENTKFFHTMATYRFRKNRIRFLSHNGNDYFKDQEKLDIATDYFQRIFTESRNWSPNILLSTLYASQADQLQSLDDNFSWEEIQRAIKQAPSNRTQGPDGFSNEFFKFYMHDLKNDLLALFQAWYNTTIDLSGVNLAYIALLPKRDAPQEMSDNRPISLQHSIPKLIAKVMANRLQQKITDLVDSMQSGFIKDRSIVEILLRLLR
jgi:hypothetical protein